jgi:outer membrane lipoprotein-sorting protein
MKQLTLFTMALAFVLTSFVSSAQENKRDEILSKHFKAVGQEKLEDVETIKMMGSTQTQGREFKFTMYLKEPNKVRNEVPMQGQKMIQAYDGENGWMLAPWASPEPQDLSGEQLEQFKKSANIRGDLHNWKEKGHELEYLGQDEMEGTPVYKLRLTKKDGDVIDYYLDKDSFIPLKQTTKTTINNQEIETETFFSNYEMINGIAMPMSMRSSGGQFSSEITIDSIKFNVDISDKLFKKPTASKSDEKEEEDSSEEQGNKETENEKQKGDDKEEK